MEPEADSNGQRSDRSRTTSAGAALGGAVDRRTVLKAAGVTTVAAGGLALGTPTVAQSEYEQTLDVVDDLGADPTGEEPINDALAEAVDTNDSVEITFPEGTYFVENGPGGTGFARWDFGEGAEETRLGDVRLVGDGDVTLRPAERGRYSILTLWARELAIENLTIDQTGTYTSTGITAVAEDELVVRDVHVDGPADGPYEPVDTPEDDYPEDPFTIIPGLLNAGGTGVIENFRAPDGVLPRGRKGGLWVNFLHAGDLLVTGCHFERFSDNAIYGSGPGGSNGEGGSVRVEDCYFRSNNTTAIRLGTPGSYAKDCTVVNFADEIPILPWGGLTGRAGWVWYDFDGYYENIRVISDHDRGVGIYDREGQSGSIEVRDCQFDLNADGIEALRLTDGSGDVTLRNVRITGDASSGAAIDVADRDLDAEGLCIHQTGSNRDGVSLSGVSGSIADGSIDVTGEAILADDASDVATSGITESGECPAVEPLHDFDPDRTVDVPPTPSPTPSPTPTKTSTATPTATTSPTAAPTGTPTDAGTPTPTDESTDTASPGLTSLTALGALGAASLAALRRATRED